MSKKFISVLSLILVLCLAFTACGGGEDVTDEPVADDGVIKVAVLNSKRGSSGFTDEGWAGADRAEAEGIAEITDVECIETADFETQARALAETGEYDLILAVGSNVSDVIGMMAGDYPDQKISIIDTKLEGFDNVRSVAAKDPEQAFLSGVLSGLVTTGNYADVFPLSNADSAVLSYAGGADIPTSRAGAAGFMAGAKYVNPEVTIDYVIVGSWNDPDKAKNIALQGIGSGADVATGNCGSGIKGVLAACKEQGSYYIATSPSDNDPEYSLCCSVKKTDVMVYNDIVAVANGTWEAGHHTFGIAEGVCDISFEGTAFEGKVPQELLDIIDDIREQVKSGELELPYDPNDVDAWAANNTYVVE